MVGMEPRNGGYGTEKWWVWNRKMVGMEPKNGGYGTEKWWVWNREMVGMEPRNQANLGVFQSARNGLTMGFFGLGNA